MKFRYQNNENTICREFLLLKFLIKMRLDFQLVILVKENNFFYPNRSLF